MIFTVFYIVKYIYLLFKFLNYYFTSEGLHDFSYECMDFGKCEDVSSDDDPATECVCQLGKIFNEDRTECVDPPPPTPSERPIPTMKVDIKA